MKFENSNRVFILNKHGKPLMPCKPRKARLLLKSNKAKIIKRYPFTIQLLYGSTGYTQNTSLGNYLTIDNKKYIKTKDLQLITHNNNWRQTSQNINKYQFK